MAHLWQSNLVKSVVHKNFKHFLSYPGPMSNDRYISVIGLGRNRCFDYDPVIPQVVIGLGRNRFIVVYLVVIGRGRNRPIKTTTDILIFQVIVI